MNVTSELLSVSFSDASTMSTVAVGFSVSIATVSVAPVAPMLPTSVGVDAGHRHRAGAVKAVVRRERRRPGDAAVARQRADSVPPTTVNVGVGKARHRLAEGERHQRAVVGVVQRSVDDVDRHRRVRVSIATVSVAPVAPMLPTSVGVDARSPSPSRCRQGRRWP